MSNCNHLDCCGQCHDKLEEVAMTAHKEVCALEAQVAELHARLKVAADFAIERQAENAKLQAVVDAAKALTESVDCYDNYGDLTEWNDRLKQAIKEVE